MQQNRMKVCLGLLIVSGILAVLGGITFLYDQETLLNMKTMLTKPISEERQIQIPFIRNTTISSGRLKSQNDTITPDTLLIPDDVVLSKMSETEHMQLYQQYINSIQALCRNVIRIGSNKDGGKEICVDNAYMPKAPCLVYSFGINNQWDFDNMVVESFGCEVHGFDPSMKKKTGQVSTKVWFYNIGLGDKDFDNEKKWEIRTLQTIRKNLKHENTTIDILKIDIDGDEWKAIPQMMKSGTLADVKQIALETHFSRRLKQPGQPFWGNVPSDKQLACLRMLYEVGFRIFMRERNLYGLTKWPPFKNMLTNVYEISLLNLQHYGR